MDKKLSPAQKKALEFMKEYLSKHEAGPDEYDFKRAKVNARSVDKLEAMGLIEKKYYRRLRQDDMEMVCWSEYHFKRDERREFLDAA